MFNDKDLVQFSSKGITPEQVSAQLDMFRTGFPYLELDSAASVGNGIAAPTKEECDSYIGIWDKYRSGDHKIVKFVPASGAASRMFKDLFGFLSADYDTPQTGFEKKFFEEIANFAFYGDLDAACKSIYGKGIDALVSEGQYKSVVAALIEKEGLKYGYMPKGLLKFHSYKQGSRTPLEEHLAEGAMYSAGTGGNVYIHFTVSPEHRELFSKLVADCKDELSKRYSVKYDISFSEQKSSTDTVAGDSENNPFRNEDGSILFRPGGHGALIENLNELDADVVFIKNIDNVVPDHLKPDTVTYKKLLAGILVAVQSRVFTYLDMLEGGKCTKEQISTIADYVKNTLCCSRKQLPAIEGEEMVEWLKSKLNRPIRVCGMVKNVGEPGGGPFLAYNNDGTISLQILESSQIDLNDQKKKEMFENGTHFNPVDLVCAIRDRKGNKFNLPEYVDKATGFISSKSKNGRSLKALELPGLWNGAMSDWNTIFVEVPLTTFNPVKTVNDLLRTQHQPH